MKDSNVLSWQTNNALKCFDNSTAYKFNYADFLGNFHA